MFADSPTLVSTPARAAWAPPVHSGLPALAEWPTHAAQSLTRAGLRWLFRAAHITVAVEHTTALPPGPKIYALNHPNMTDPLIVTQVVAEPLCGLMQADLFAVPALGWLLARTGCLPVTRGGGSALLAAASRKLAAGYTVAICPEGRLNNGGPLAPGHTGAVRLALAAGVPLVPLGLYVRPEDVLDIHHFRYGRPARGRVQVSGVCYATVGAAWWPAPAPAGVEPAEHLRRATAELMQRLATLTQQAAARCGAWAPEKGSPA